MGLGAKAPNSNLVWLGLLYNITRFEKANDMQLEICWDGVGKCVALSNHKLHCWGLACLFVSMKPLSDPDWADVE